MVPFFAQAEDAIPTGTLRHTYTITTATGRGLKGYWFNNIGSITASAYTLPNTLTGTIRQSMIIDPNSGGGSVDHGEFRFLINFPSQSVAAVDQFPIRIDCERGSAAPVICLPQTPDQIAQFGQGIGRDYGIVSGDTGDIFVNGEITTIKLYY